MPSGHATDVVMKHPRQRVARGLLVMVCCASVAIVCTWMVLPDYRNAIRDQQERFGVAVVDRNGSILRLLPDPKGRTGLWRDGKSFPDHLKAAMISAEDKRFRYHPGFDPIAIARALYCNIRQQRTVSGASTITQQAVRLIRPRPRTYVAKIVELLASIKMECQLSKEQILELHLNLSPMGANIRGAGLASCTYFGKDVENIGLAEAAVLAALPRSPSRLDPRKPAGCRRVMAEKDRILKRMAATGVIGEDQLRVNLGPSVAFTNRSIPLQAPHFVEMVLGTRHATGSIVRTTLDLDLQQGVEQVLQSHRRRLRDMGIDQAAVIIASCHSSEVLALVGSFRYGEENQGFNNGARARRSAGSTLKPFLYALALEKGYGSSSEVSDTYRVYQTPHGDYMPMNADRREYGPVNVRSALGNSLNLPAVKVARWVGAENLYGLLDHLEVVQADSPPPEHYGLGLAIGNVEVSLYRLVQAYLTLARGGEFLPLRVTRENGTYRSRVVSPDIAYVITHILADPSARLLTFGNPHYFDFGFPVAVKTGTSSNYRDAWAVGYTTRHVVGIWAGNFDNRPSPGSMGAAVCGPILSDAIRLLYGGTAPKDFARPAGVREERVCAMSGKLASPRCPYVTSELVAGRRKLATCDLPHDDERHQLGSNYAKWLHAREAQLGTSRFQLMKAKNIPEHPRETVGRPGSAGQTEGMQASSIEIVSPHNRDRFVLSRHGGNRIVFRALPGRVVGRVVWYLDGTELAQTGPPYEFPWEPTRGSHELLAVMPNMTAGKASFFVE